MQRIQLTRHEWIMKYGGYDVLAADGYTPECVVPCVNCDDSLCHGWRVVTKAHAHEYPPIEELPERAVDENGRCLHSHVWPNGDCCWCGRLATMFTRRTMVPWPTTGPQPGSRSRRT